MYYKHLFGILQVWSNSKEQSIVPLAGRGGSQGGSCSKKGTWLSAIALPHSLFLQTPIYPYKHLQCLSAPDFTAFLLLLCQMSWELLKLQIMLWGRGLRRDRHFLSPKGRNWQLIFASRSFPWGRLIKPDEKPLLQCWRALDLMDSRRLWRQQHNDFLPFFFHREKVERTKCNWFYYMPRFVSQKS